MDRLEELNKICLECQEQARKRGESIDASKCMRCPTGQAVHDLEVKARSPWNKVDWTNSQYEDLYHG